MNKTIKQKRNQLILVSLLTLLVLAGAYYWLIRSQQQDLRSLSDRNDKAQQRLSLIKREITAAETFECQLSERLQQLQKLENGMASGDLYSWSINTIRQFKLPYRIDIPQFSQIDGPREVTLIPRFPYKQATLSVAGTGHFQDLGRFIADFENQFSHMRIINLVLEPEAATTEASEKLSFKMDIVTLVKPSGS